MIVKQWETLVTGTKLKLRKQIIAGWFDLRIFLQCLSKTSGCVQFSHFVPAHQCLMENYQFEDLIERMIGWIKWARHYNYIDTYFVSWYKKPEFKLPVKSICHHAKRRFGNLYDNWRMCMLESFQMAVTRWNEFVNGFFSRACVEQRPNAPWWIHAYLVATHDRESSGCLRPGWSGRKNMCSVRVDEEKSQGKATFPLFVLDILPQKPSAHRVDCVALQSNGIIVVIQMWVIECYQAVDL